MSIEEENKQLREKLQKSEEKNERLRKKLQKSEEENERLRKEILQYEEETRDLKIFCDGCNELVWTDTTTMCDGCDNYYCLKCDKTVRGICDAAICPNCVKDPAVVKKWMD